MSTMLNMERVLASGQIHSLSMKKDFNREDHKKNLILTPIQREILFGMLLGDAHITIPRNCVNASVAFGQSSKQRPFIEHLFKVFQDWTWQTDLNSYKDSRKGYDTVCESLRFRTFTHPILTKVYKAFYPNGAYKLDGTRAQKRIPYKVTTWLTPRVLAYHLMSDGSLGRSRQVYLHTHGFSQRDSLRYVDGVNKVFDLHGYVRKYGVYYHIIFPARDLPRLREITKSFFLPFFYYKLGIREV